MRGFFIGRFQPYHQGHHDIILEILEEVDELVIGIGSSQESHSIKNPFTAGERMLMVSKALEEIKTDKKAYVVPLEDIYRNSLWVPHVQSMIPPIDVAYSNNPLVRRLFNEAGYEIKKTVLRNREEYQGTEIRKRILEKNHWEALVPESVARVIVEVGGVERIKEVSGSDIE